MTWTLLSEKIAKLQAQVDEHQSCIENLGDKVGIDPKGPLCECNCHEQPSNKIDLLYDAAVEAIEHMAQANWSGRKQAAKIWLRRIKNGDTSQSLDQIQKEINNE